MLSAELGGGVKGETPKLVLVHVPRKGYRILQFFTSRSSEDPDRKANPDSRNAVK